MALSAEAPSLFFLMAGGCCCCCCCCYFVITLLLFCCRVFLLRLLLLGGVATRCVISDDDDGWLMLDNDDDDDDDVSVGTSIGGKFAFWGAALFSPRETALAFLTVTRGTFGRGAVPCFVSEALLLLMLFRRCRCHSRWFMTFVIGS